MTPARRIFHACRTLTALLLMVLLATPAAWAAERSGFKVKRGTNISHWLSQSRNRGAERLNWFTKEDVAFLAGLGFDHLRIPIDEEQMWDASGNLTRS
jgi:endoglucanase